MHNARAAQPDARPAARCSGSFVRVRKLFLLEGIILIRNDAHFANSCTSTSFGNDLLRGWLASPTRPNTWRRATDRGRWRVTVRLQVQY